MRVPNLVRELFGGRLSPQGKKIFRYATGLASHLEEYTEGGLPLHIVWLDGRAEPIASALYLKLRLNDSRIRHGPFASTYTTDYEQHDVVVGIDYELDQENEERLRSMVPALRKKQASGIVYASVHPNIEVKALSNGNNGGTKS